MKPTPAFAVISFSADAISSAWSRDSSAQGPAMIESGSLLPISTEPIRTTELGAVISLVLRRRFQIALRHGGKFGEADTAVDLRQLPFIDPLLLGALSCHFIGEPGGNHHHALPIGNHDIVGEDRDAAAGDGLLPGGEHQPRPRRPRRDAVHPDPKV